MSVYTNQQGYSIKEAAQLIGLPESTLRYYETIGLMNPVGRDPSSKHRKYTDPDIDQAVAVACLNATGMSIETMRAYLANRGQGAHSAKEQLDLLENHQQHLAEEASRLGLRQRYLDAKIAYWQAVLAGDTAQAQEIGKSAKLISQELRARDKLPDTSMVTL